MMKKATELSNTRYNRLQSQGYISYTRQELNELAFGHRFGLQLCTMLLFIGLVTTNLYVLSFITLIAAMAVILPYHPFDYIYNYVLRGKIHKPKLPPRSNQIKFACGLAMCCVASVVFLFYNNMYAGGYILGGTLLIVALLVSTLDLCIPSEIYNSIFNVKLKNTSHVRIEKKFIN